MSIRHKAKPTAGPAPLTLEPPLDLAGRARRYFIQAVADAPRYYRATDVPALAAWARLSADLETSRVPTAGPELEDYRKRVMAHMQLGRSLRLTAAARDENNARAKPGGRQSQPVGLAAADADDQPIAFRGPAAPWRQ